MEYMLKEEEKDGLREKVEESIEDSFEGGRRE